MQNGKNKTTPSQIRGGKEKAKRHQTTNLRKKKETNLKPKRCSLQVVK